MTQWKIQPEDWKEDYKEFDEATEKFYRGEMDAKTYKGHFWRLRKLCPKRWKCQYAPSAYVRRCYGSEEA